MLDQTVLFESPRITLLREKHIDNSSQVVHEHLSIRHPGAVVVLPINHEGRVLLVRQFRPSVRRILIEAPAGALEGIEPPEIAAQRELQEETGYAAQNLKNMGILYPTPGFCDEVQHLFFATDLIFKPLEADPDEEIDVLPYSISELDEQIRSGALCDGKTLAIVMKARILGLLK